MPTGRDARETRCRRASRTDAGLHALSHKRAPVANRGPRLARVARAAHSGPVTSSATLDVPHADATVLDNAAWHSLTGPHASFAIGGDLVRRYPGDVAPFVAVRTWDEPGVWDALRELVGPGSEVGLSGYEGGYPAGWEYLGGGEGVQLVETDALRPRPDEEAIELGPDDAADMLAIVDRNQPGPFRPRTYELGRYIGIRRDGRLIAMAGERLHPTGWTEISAVSVDAEHRRQGLASRLVLDVAFHIQARGERALLHAAASNLGAIAAYERLGFALRRRNQFAAVRTPA